MLPPTDGTAGDVTAAIAALTPQLFSDAIPALCAPWSAFGREVLLEGFLASGPLSLPLPTAPPASVRVQIGNHRSRFTLIPRRIVALPGPAALVVTWATSFRWLFNPLDARAMSLDWNRP